IVTESSPTTFEGIIFGHGYSITNVFSLSPIVRRSNREGESVLRELSLCYDKFISEAMVHVAHLRGVVVQHKLPHLPKDDSFLGIIWVPTALLNDRKLALLLLKNNLRHAQSRMKQFSDLKRSTRNYNLTVRHQ
ncbi:hypothetical protein V2J09_001064, partial [Rumex salicifolius]